MSRVSSVKYNPGNMCSLIFPQILIQLFCLLTHTMQLCIHPYKNASMLTSAFRNKRTQKTSACHRGKLIFCVYFLTEKNWKHTQKTFKGDTKSMAQYRNLFIPHSTFTAWLEGSAHGIKHTLGYQICSMHTAGVRKMRGGMALKSVMKKKKETALVFPPKTQLLLISTSESVSQY